MLNTKQALKESEIVLKKWREPAKAIRLKLQVQDWPKKPFYFETIVRSTVCSIHWIQFFVLRLLGLEAAIDEHEISFQFIVRNQTGYLWLILMRIAIRHFSRRIFFRSIDSRRNYILPNLQVGFHISNAEILFIVIIEFINY